MKILSERTVKEAIDCCVKHPEYKVIIASSDLETLHTISDNLTEILSNRHCVEWSRQSRLNPYVAVFRNKSQLQVIRATESARGHRCDLLIIDPNAPYDIVVNVLRPLELVGLYERRNRF